MSKYAGQGNKYANSRCSGITGSYTPPFKICFAADFRAAEAGTGGAFEAGKLLSVLDGGDARKEIRQGPGLNVKKAFGRDYRQSATAQGIIGMTVFDKPHGRMQNRRNCAGRYCPC